MAGVAHGVQAYRAGKERGGGGGEAADGAGAAAGVGWAVEVPHVQFIDKVVTLNDVVNNLETITIRHHGFLGGLEHRRRRGGFWVWDD